MKNIDLVSSGAKENSVGEFFLAPELCFMILLQSISTLK